MGSINHKNRFELILVFSILFPIFMQAQNWSMGVGGRIPRAELGMNLKYLTKKKINLGVNLFAKHLNTSSFRLKGFGLEGMKQIPLGTQYFTEIGLAHNFMFEHFEIGTIEQQSIQGLFNFGIFIKRFDIRLQSGLNYDYFYNINFRNNKSNGTNSWKDHHYFFMGFGVSWRFNFVRKSD